MRHPIRLILIGITYGWMVFFFLFASAQNQLFQSQLTIASTTCPGGNGWAPVNGISIGPLTLGPGLGCVNHSSPVGINANGFSLSTSLDVTQGDYFEFIVSGNGCPFQLDSLRVWFRKSNSDPPHKIQAYYYINTGTLQPIGSVIDISPGVYANSTLFPLTLDFSSIPALAASDQIRIRVYGFNAGTQTSTSNGTLRWVSQPANPTILYGKFPALQAGTVTSDQVICQGSTGSLNLSGHNGLIVGWEYAYSPYSSWTSLPNSTVMQSYAGHTQSVRYRALVSCGVIVDTAVEASLTWGEANAQLSGGASICTGPATQLTVNLGGIPPWDVTYTDGTTQYSITGVSASPLLIAVNPTYSSTYTLVSVQNICGSTPQISGSAIVSKGYQHQASLTGNFIFCGSPQPVQLSVNYAGGGLPPFTLQYTDGTTNFTQSGITSNPYLIDVTPTSTATYGLISSTSGICSGLVRGIAQVGIYPLPAVNFSVPSSVCLPNPLVLNFQLTGVSPWSVTYLDGTSPITIAGISNSPFAIPVQNPVSTVYQPLSVSDANCTATAAGVFPVSIHPQPTATISANSTLMCQGDSLSLFMQLEGSAPWNLVWSDGVQNNPINGQTDVFLFIPLVAQVNKTYSIVSISDPYCVGVAPAPVVVTVLDTVFGSWTGDTTICWGDSAQLSLSLGGTPGWGFTWDNEGIPQTVFNSPQPQWSYTVSPKVTTTYPLVNLENICGSKAPNQSVVIQVRPLPSLTVIGDSFVCDGDPADLTLQLTGTGPWTVYTFNQDELDSIVSIPAQTYTFQIPGIPPTVKWFTNGIRDSFCTYLGIDSIEIPVLPKPTPDFSWKDSSLYVSFLNLTPVAGYDSLLWDLGDGGYQVDSSFVHTYLLGGRYPVELTAWLGPCPAKREIEINLAQPYYDYLVVYNNPNDGNFSFSVNYLKEGDPIQLGIITRDGSVLWEENPVSTGFRVYREFKWKDKIARGIYFLRAITPNGIFHSKLVVE